MVTDVILVYAPIQLIWGIRFPQTIKIRLIAVFAATLIITAASLYQIYASLKVHGITEDIAATILVSSARGRTQSHVADV
jgi:hypothetical protein